MRREEQKIILVTGKGGVGKTAVASALALAEVHSSRAVLLAELGEKSFLHSVFPGAGGFSASPITDGLDVVRWDAEQCLREYFRHYLKVERLVELIFSNRVMRTVMNAAPAVRELALLGKITSGPRGVGPDLPYDTVVVDAFATGHFKALCQAPLGMTELVSVGPMAEHSRAMVDLFRRHENLHVVLVTVPEELAVNEAEELYRFLEKTFGLRATVVLNRNLPLPLSAEELSNVRPRLLALSQPPPWANDFIDYLETQGRRQEAAADRIRSWQAPMIELPLYFETRWPELIRVMAQELGKKWPTG